MKMIQFALSLVDIKTIWHHIQKSVWQKRHFNWEITETVSLRKYDRNEENTEKINDIPFMNCLHWHV